jgi:hypothetical protein
VAKRSGDTALGGEQWGLFESSDLVGFTAIPPPFPPNGGLMVPLIAFRWIMLDSVWGTLARKNIFHRNSP